MQTMAQQGGDDISDHSSEEGSAEWYSCSSGPPPSSDSDLEDDDSSGPIALQLCPCDPNGWCHCSSIGSSDEPVVDAVENCQCAQSEEDSFVHCSVCGSIVDSGSYCPMLCNVIIIED